MEPSDDAIVELAAEILARREYARFRPSAVDSGMDELLRRLIAFLDDLPHLKDTSPVVFWSLLIGLLAVAMLLIFHMVWTVQQALRFQPSAPVHAALAPARDFAAEAEELAARGAFLEASHRLLLASLAHAAHAHLLELQPHDSNRAICRKLAEAPLARSLRDPLIALIERTDAAWFGHRSDDPSLFDAWRTTFASLRGTAALRGTAGLRATASKQGTSSLRGTPR